MDLYDKSNKARNLEREKIAPDIFDSYNCLGYQLILLLWMPSSILWELQAITRSFTTLDSIRSKKLLRTCTIKRIRQGIWREREKEKSFAPDISDSYNCLDIDWFSDCECHLQVCGDYKRSMHSKFCLLFLVLSK